MIGWQIFRYWIRKQSIRSRRDADAGVRYVIEGGVERKIEDMAAPDGTTFLVRSLFYNTRPGGNS